MTSADRLDGRTQLKVLVLCGPTGVGKTEVAVELARKYKLEIISADSRQVYSWLDIGTAKPSPELRREVGIHMVDMVEPNRVYSAADFARDALVVMRHLRRDGKRFTVVGGAGMYLKALFEPFFEAPKPDPVLRQRLEAESSFLLHDRLKQIDPERAAKLHPNDRQRVIRALEVYESTNKTMTELSRATRPKTEFEPVYVVLTMERETLRQRLDERFDTMMRTGLLDEVRRLRESGFGRDTYVANAYGYAELLRHLEGELVLERAVAEAKAKTRAYAKRQMTWFRSLKDACWFECKDTADAVRLVGPLLQQVLAEH
ncbi:tRNA (adenosine(37)-N6)-dimethylallyltransferase MiaA [candidate division WOR-3 bacterium]|uniref:tRNA dimethylallyltransferase n=1 Tax=candidate division WOR-3 bacterium TaxID=2052148 RepID=A0A937XBL7_UNCW3|nr:tRNA (adenosine(37)-N6)-dimethylallyltransferase MiaA [candidate division WOR-3 bacterium]